MTWEEVVADPDLQHLRYKIETNELGQIVMSPPPSFFHQQYEAIIVRLLNSHLSAGLAVQECPVQTPGGTKVADVAWISDARRRQAPRRAALTVAPEICVEVVSPSNTPGELLAKRDIYFAAGALEFWLCDETGDMSFFDCEGGELANSALCPDFPLRVEN